MPAALITLNDLGFRVKRQADKCLLETGLQSRFLPNRLGPRIYPLICVDCFKDRCCRRGSELLLGSREAAGTQRLRPWLMPTALDGAGKLIVSKARPDKGFLQRGPQPDFLPDRIGPRVNPLIDSNELRGLGWSLNDVFDQAGPDSALLPYRLGPWIGPFINCDALWRDKGQRLLLGSREAAEANRLGPRLVPLALKGRVIWISIQIDKPVLQMGL